MFPLANLSARQFFADGIRSNDLQGEKRHRSGFLEGREEMALVRCCHVIAKGDLSKAMSIAPLILEKGLLVSHAPWGAAAWAFHIDLVPSDKRQLPMVVFDVESDYVEEKNLGTLKDGKRYFTLKLRGSLKVDEYVPIQVRGFVNLSLSPVYDGPIGFF